LGGFLAYSGMPLSLPVLLLIFAGLSLLAWLIMRRIFSGPNGQVTTFDHDVND
jgi:hypothetical protein